MTDLFPRRAYTPERDDNLRDMADDAGDVAQHAQSILDTLHNNPDVIDGCLSHDDAYALEDLLAKLAVEVRKVQREANDSLGANA